MNAGSNWANTAVAGVVQLVLIPITLRALGESGYGVWALFAYGLSYPMILEGAFALSINRFVAYYANNQGQLSRYVSASFVILTGLAVLTAGAAVLVSFVVADIFAAIPDELAGPAQVTCILVGLTLALKMLESTFSGALKGFQYYTRCNGVVIWTTILRAILTVALLYFWKSIIAVQLAFVITGMISAVLMFLVARKSIPGLSVSVRLIDKDTMRELWRYTSHSIARSGSKIAMENTLMLLVGWKGTATDVAVYNIAFRLPGMIHGFLVGAQNVFLPALTSLCADGQIEKIKAVVKKGTQICSVLTLLSSILLFAFAERILVHWLGAPEQTVGVMYVVILSVVPGGLFEI
ncbi:MAG TPA: oligosaccharide flippase family protein, partial [Sedimentisphaerales bacterium]|nr:oligosaccharide flippase family protein [Sedimentisphaerales bacterium]